MLHKLKLSGKHVRQAVPTLVAVLIIGFISYQGAHFYNKGQAATPGSIYITPAAKNVVSGTTFSVTVREDSGTARISLAKFHLTYDPSQLEYAGRIETGEFSSQVQSSSVPGSIIIQRGASGSGLAGDHGIVTLNFKVAASFGQASVSLRKANSSLIANGQNILQTVTDAAYTISRPAGSVTKNAIFTLTPASGTYTKDAVIPVAVRLASPTQKVVSVRPVLIYPADKLAYAGTVASALFPTATKTANPSGTVELIRDVPAGSAGFTGNDVVVTVNFRVIAAGSSAAVSLGSSSAAMITGNQNILGSSTGSTYTVTGSTAPASPSGGPQPGGSVPPPAVPKVTAPTAVPPAPAKAAATQIAGNVQLAPMSDTGQAAGRTGGTKVKVEYYLGNKLVATRTAEPFTYTLDTKAYKNGTYDMTVRTAYKNGTVRTSSDKVVVKNPVNPAYVMVHYRPQAIGTLAALVTLGFVVFRFIMPRFSHKAFASATDDGYTGYVGPNGIYTTPAPAEGGESAGAAVATPAAEPAATPAAPQFTPAADPYAQTSPQVAAQPFAQSAPAPAGQYQAAPQAPIMQPAQSGYQQPALAPYPPAGYASPGSQPPVQSSPQTPPPHVERTPYD